VRCKVFDSINIISAMKRAPHTGLPVGLCNVPMAKGAGRRIHVTGIHLLRVHYSWTPPSPWIERRDAESCRSDQKASGFPLPGLAPTKAHTDTIIPKALLGNNPKRDEIQGGKQRWKVRIILFCEGLPVSG
jgi:hypothetical protein